MAARKAAAEEGKALGEEGTPEADEPLATPWEVAAAPGCFPPPPHSQDDMIGSQGRGEGRPGCGSAAEGAEEEEAEAEAWAEDKARLAASYFARAAAAAAAERVAEA